MIRHVINKPSIFFPSIISIFIINFNIVNCIDIDNSSFQENQTIENLTSKQELETTSSIHDPNYGISHHPLSSNDSGLPLKMIWVLICININLFLLLITIIVHTFILEQQNLPGFIFRRYLISYIICLCACQILLFIPTGSIPYIIFFHTTIYFACSYSFWLNIMSIDIWQTFRKFSLNSNINDKKHEKMILRNYSIYAWGSSAFYVIIIFSASSIYGRTKVMDSILNLIFSPFIVIAFCNIILYTWTALMIRKQKYETADIIDGINKHQKENEERFNVYVKLFIIMGGPAMCWAVSFYFRDTMFMVILIMIKPIQGLLLFIMFVWKNDVKRSMKKRFNQIIPTNECIISNSDYQPNETEIK